MAAHTTLAAFIYGMLFLLLLMTGFVPGEYCSDAVDSSQWTKGRSLNMTSYVFVPLRLLVNVLGVKKLFCYFSSLITFYYIHES